MEHAQIELPLHKPQAIDHGSVELCLIEMTRAIDLGLAELCLIEMKEN